MLSIARSWMTSRLPGLSGQGDLGSDASGRSSVGALRDLHQDSLRRASGAGTEKHALCDSACAHKPPLKAELGHSSPEHVAVFRPGVPEP